MTDISLPYDQVCEIVDQTVREWVCPGAQQPATTNQRSFYRLYLQFSHTLLRALEEAHFARQGKE